MNNQSKESKEMLLLTKLFRITTSTLGQGLQTSTYPREVIFFIAMAILGLILFALLIGNMQTYLQSLTIWLEEMRIVKALTEVEAFVLIAEELKFVVSQFRCLHSRQVQHTFRFYLQQWRTWVACFIQAAWRGYSKRTILIIANLIL